MKKKILLILILFIPLIVNAKEYCKVESGNLNTIGSEISCGNEHFYIIDSNENEVKMLSKYNLYVGANYDKIVLDPSKYYEKIECSNGNCSSYSNFTYYFDGNQVDYDEFMNKIMEKYELDSLDGIESFALREGKSAYYMFVPGEEYVEEGKTYRNDSIKIYPYTVINNYLRGEYALQNELARGVTGEKGNANYPIYATFNLFPTGYQNRSNLVKSYDNFLDGYTNIEFIDDSYIVGYLYDYKDQLNDMGYDVSSVDMLNISNLDNLIYSISKKHLPLSQWLSNEISPTEEDGTSYSNIGDLKQFVSDDYKWIWNTSYWLKTLAGNYTSSSNEGSDFAYFVSSSGDICMSSTNCGGIPRAGLRPTVTIAKDNIKYNIRTKTDGNGTIEVIDRAAGGEVISFKVSAKKGLKLAGLTVTTDSQEKVQFNEEDLTTNKDGTVSISTNKFTMPYENVTIEARWATTINPLTVSSIFIFFLILIASVCIIFKIYTKKKEKKDDQVEL